MFPLKMIILLTVTYFAAATIVFVTGALMEQMTPALAMNLIFLLLLYGRCQEIRSKS